MCSEEYENFGQRFRRIIVSIAERLGADTSEFKNAKSFIKWIIAKTYWLITVVLFGYFMVVSSREIVSDYLAERTTSTLEFMFNNSIALPLSTVCLPLTPDELVENEKTADVTGSINITYYQEKLISVFDENKSKERILDQEIVWPKSLLFIVQKYLTLMSRFEALDCNMDGEFDINGSSNGLELIFKDFDRRLKVLKISTNELRQKFGHEISRLYAFSIVHTSEDGKREKDVETDRVSHIDFKQICYQVRLDLHSLNTLEDVIKINASRTSLINPDRTDESTQQLQAYLDFSARDKVDNDLVDSNQVHALQFNQETLFAIKIVAVYRAMPYANREQRCVEEKPKDRCVAECKNAQIVEWCKCTSSSTHMPPPLNEECKYVDYASCLQEMHYTDDLLQCTGSCLSSCEHQNYHVQSTSETKFYQNQLIAKLAIVSFVYPVFEETSAWKFSSFIGTLGGILGLWLGLNLFDAIQSVTNIIILLSGKKKPKNQNDINDRSEAENHKEEEIERDVTWTYKSVNALQNLLKNVINSCQMHNDKIANEKHIVTYLVWALAGLSLLTCAILLTLEKYQDYTSNPSTSDLTLMSNSTITLPNSTVCVPLFIGELCKDANLTTNSVFMNDLNKYLHENTFDGDIVKLIGWSKYLLHVIHAYLIEISNCENIWQLAVGKCGSSEIYKDANLIAAMRALETKMTALNVSIEELGYAFGFSVIQTISYFIFSGFGLGNQDGLYKFLRFTFADEKQICYHIPFQSSSLPPSNQVGFFQIEAHEMFLPNMLRKGADRGSITVDLLNRKYVDTDKAQGGMIDSVIALPMGSETFINIEPTSNFIALQQAKDGSGIQCTTETNMDDCQTNCQIKLIHEQCNCTPFIWQQMYGKVLSQSAYQCTIEDYWSCINKSASDTFKICSDKCLQPCGRWNFKFLIYSTHLNSLTYNTFRMTRMNYPVIVEKRIWSLQNFVGDIGGIIGFMLGMSLFQFVQYLITLAIKFISYIHSKLNRKAANEETMVIELQQQPAASSQILTPLERADKKADLRIRYKIKKTRKKIVEGLQRIIRNKPLIVSKLTEYTILVLFSYLTARMGMELAQQYQQGNSTTSMNLIFNKSIALPVTTVCVPPNTGDDGFADSIEGDATALHSKVEDYFTNRANMTKKTFLRAKDWSKALQYIVNMYFRIMNEIEASPDITLEFYMLTKTPAMVLLENHMQALGVTTDELRQAFGGYVLDLFSLRVVQNGPTTTNKGCAVPSQRIVPVSYVTSATQHLICYRVPFDQFPFSDPQQTIIITANGASQQLLKLDFSARNTTSIEENNHLDGDIQPSFVSQLRYTISIDAVYRSLASERCDEVKSRENCIVQCQVNFVRENCNCTPVSWSAYSSDTAPSNSYQECRLRDLVNCQGYEDRKTKGNCSEFCTERCNTWSWRIYQTETKNDVKTNDTLRIELKVVAFHYPSFVERKEWTFDTITGAIGGVIGFYLGLDFFMITQLLVAAIIMVKRMISGFLDDS